MAWRKPQPYGTIESAMDWAPIKPRLRNKSKGFLTVAGLFYAATCAPAFAGANFYELSGGISQIYLGQNFFGTDAPPSTGYGLGLNVGLYHSFSEGKLPIEFILGVQDRLTSGSGTTNVYTMQTIYPMMRVQGRQVFIGLGISPFLFRTVDSAVGIINFSDWAKPSIAVIGEAGALWAVTPFFNLGGSAALQIVRSSAGLGPKPAVDVSVVMRIYLSGEAYAAKTNSTGTGFGEEFTGWRYPFGIPKDN